MVAQAKPEPIQTEMFTELVDVAVERFKDCSDLQLMLSRNVAQAFGQDAEAFRIQYLLQLRESERESI